jgi:predicted DNA-binding transcriptional regulator YafY
VTAFILEGEQRHPHQTIRKGKGARGELTHVDYAVKLPERSLDEFVRWVHRYMQYAQILSPARLAERHRNAARELLARYC